MILKGIDAVIEIVASFAVLFVSKAFVLHLVTMITQGELAEDPKDLLANYLVRAAQLFSVDTQKFAFIYLLTHGLVKLFLVIGLLKKKAWAYPTSIILLGLFILYQLYRYAHTQSPLLMILTIFDLIVLWLVWKEYEYILRRRDRA